MTINTSGLPPTRISKYGVQNKVDPKIVSAYMGEYKIRLGGIRDDLILFKSHNPEMDIREQIGVSEGSLFTDADFFTAVNTFLFNSNWIFVPDFDSLEKGCVKENWRGFYMEGFLYQGKK